MTPLLLRVSDSKNIKLGTEERFVNPRAACRPLDYPLIFMISPDLYCCQNTTLSPLLLREGDQLTWKGSCA